MTDLILGNEVSEFVANRQTAKIQFLQQENQQLLDTVKDLEKALNLNKDILRITFESQKQNIHNSSDTTNTSQIDNANKSIIRKLHEENLFMAHQLKKMTDERNTSQNKLLLQSQISEESQSFYKDMIQDLEDKVQELRRIIYDKEYAIQEYEKIKTTTDTDGQMIKMREIITPNEQSLRLHEELESTRAILNKISAESQNISDLNVQLQETNFNFKRELIKIRIVLNNPISYYKMKDFIYNDQYGNTDDNLELQNEIYGNQVYMLGDYESEQQQQQQNAMQNNQEQQNIAYGSKLTSVKFLSSNERQMLQDKLQKSETLVKGFKELFEREKNKNILLASKFDDLQRQYANAEEINGTLLRAIKSRDKRIIKYQDEVKYYKKQYGNYINLLKNKRRVNLSFEKIDSDKNTNSNNNKARILDQLTGKISNKYQSKTPSNNKQGIQYKTINQQSKYVNTVQEEIDVFDDVNVNISILDDGKQKIMTYNDEPQILDENNSYINSLDENDFQDQDEEADQFSSEQELVIDKDQQSPIQVLTSNNKKSINQLIIQTEHDEYAANNKFTKTSKNKPITEQIQKQQQYQMAISECKQFLLSSAKELYMIYNLRMNNLQRKKLLGQSLPKWGSAIPIWHQKSSSDPLDYFTRNLQDLQIKPLDIQIQRIKAKQKNDLFKQQLEKRTQNAIQSNHPFYLDVSLIHDKKDEKTLKQKKKNPKKVTINAELSFISNDNVLENIQE